MVHQEEVYIRLEALDRTAEIEEARLVDKIGKFGDRRFDDNET